jgi:hypothetical protein
MQRRRGCPVKIISISQQEEKLELHEGALIGVLDKVCATERARAGVAAQTSCYLCNST